VSVCRGLDWNDRVAEWPGDDSTRSSSNRFSPRVREPRISWRHVKVTESAHLRTPEVVSGNALAEISGHGRPTFKEVTRK